MNVFEPKLTKAGSDPAFARVDPASGLVVIPTMSTTSSAWRRSPLAPGNPADEVPYRHALLAAVAGVRTIRNPVLAALEVMRQARRVLLGADGAERLARERGLEIVEPSYFSTPQRLAQLRAAQAHDRDQAVDDAVVAVEDNS